MGRRKCDSCNKEIGSNNDIMIRLPEEECKYCKSNIYSEYFFCSTECAIFFLQKRESEQAKEIITGDINGK